MYRNHWLAGALATVVGTIASGNILAAQGAASSGKAAPPAASAKKPAATSCAKPDTTAVWYKRQRKMLDETGLTWTSDSLRVALLSATGLTLDAALTPSLGWQIFDGPPTITPAESAMVANLKKRGGRGGRGRGGAPAGANGAAPGASGTSATTATVAGSGTAGAAATGSGAPGAPNAGAAGRGGAPPAGGGWPLKSTVGVAGVQAVFQLLELDSALQESGMHQMMEPGPDEAVAVDIAIINDRVQLLKGRKQIDGTQLHRVNGKLVPLPMEDSAHVDIRRADAGLPPLVWSVCNANYKP